MLCSKRKTVGAAALVLLFGSTLLTGTAGAVERDSQETVESSSTSCFFLHDPLNGAHSYKTKTQITGPRGRLQVREGKTYDGRIAIWGRVDNVVNTSDLVRFEVDTNGDGKANCSSVYQISNRNYTNGAPARYGWYGRTCIVTSASQDCSMTTKTSWTRLWI